METYLTKKNKNKEVTKNRLYRRMVSVTNEDLLQQQVEVIVNSIGVPVSSGFGGYIAQNILKETGDSVKDEAVAEAKRIFKTEEIAVGEYVTTSAGKSERIKYIIHWHWPNFTDANSQKILICILSL